MACCPPWRLHFDDVIGDAPRPVHLSEMITAAQKLGDGLDFVTLASIQLALRRLRAQGVGRQLWECTITKVGKRMVKGPSPERAVTTRLRRFRPLNAGG